MCMCTCATLYWLLTDNCSKLFMYFLSNPYAFKDVTSCLIQPGHVKITYLPEAIQIWERSPTCIWSSLIFDKKFFPSVWTCSSLWWWQTQISTSAGKDSFIVSIHIRAALLPPDKYIWLKTGTRSDLTFLWPPWAWTWNQHIISAVSDVHKWIFIV